MKANIGIPEEHLQALSAILNTVLADEYVLYTKTRKYHWNVTGIHFQQLHAFFESQYEELDEIIDEVAERVRTLGDLAAGSLASFLSVTRLTEDQTPLTDARQMLFNLLDDHQIIIRSLRTEIPNVADNLEDVATSDFLTGLLAKHEKMAWMLRAHLE